MKHPSRIRLAAGVVAFASSVLAWAVEPTAQLWNEIGAGSASNGGISQGTTPASSPSAVINPANGNVYVAWEAGNSEIYVRRWTGSEWVQVGNSATGGGVSNNAGASRFPSIALTPGEGLPVVAWLDDTSGNWEVYLKKLSLATNTWVGVGGSAEGGGVSKAAGAISKPEGALPVVGASGGVIAGAIVPQVFVAWATNATERHVHVSTQTSAGWARLGGTVDSIEYGSDGPTLGFPSYLGASSPALVVGPDNAPVAAYVTTSAASSGDIHVRRWNGSGWVPHGNGAAMNGGISGHPTGTEYRLSRPRLALGSNGQLHAAWLYAEAEKQLAHVKRLDGTTWVSAGPPLDVRAAVFESEIVFGIAGDNSAFLAWAENLPVLNPIGNSEIYVSRLIRTNIGAAIWQEYGIGSASETGISDTAFNSTQPAIAISRTGPIAPVIAWTDQTATNDGLLTQIYARRANAPATIVEFAQPVFNTKEGAPPVVVPVVRRGDLSREGRVRYATANNTATAGADYTAVEGELVFAPGDAIKNFSVAALSDDLVEPVESARLILSNPSEGMALGANAQASLMIADALPGTTPTLHFHHPGIVLGEGAGRAVLEVVREGSSEGTVSVDYATPGAGGIIAGGATPNLDYTPVSGTLRFESGVMSRSIEVPVLEDTLVEPRESFVVQLTNPTGGATLVAPTVSTIAIEDNDQLTNPPGRLQFRLATQVVGEGAGKATIEVIRVEGSGGEVTVNYETAALIEGGAMAGSDYTTVSGTLSFGAGVTSRTFEVPILEDNLTEPAEGFGVKLSAPTGGALLGAPAGAVVQIADNDVPPPPTSTVQFNPIEYLTSEAAGVANLRVTRAGDIAAGASVDYYTPEVAIAVVGVATPGFDYEVKQGTLTFAPGETEKTVSIVIKQDEQAEPNEFFHVSLRNPQGTALGQAATAKVLITSQIVPPPPTSTVQFNPIEYLTNEAAGVANLRVTRSGNTEVGAAVDYFTPQVVILIAGVATPGSDYEVKEGTLTFAPGETEKTISVVIKQDEQAEPNEFFHVALRNPQGTILGQAATAKVVIASQNVPPPPSTVQFNPVEYATSEAAGVATLRVTRAGNTATGAAVDYFTPEVAITVVGVATPGADYEVKQGTLTFAPGETEKTISITIKRDDMDEPNEVFDVVLRNPQGTTLGQPVMARVVIKPDFVPQPGVFGFALTEFRTTENAGQAVITVVRRNGSSGEASVRYATVPALDHARPATADEDYTPVSGVLNFAAGEVSKTFSVPILQDALVEGLEGVSLVLSEATGTSLPDVGAKAMLVIADDDQPAGSLQFASAFAQIREGAGSVTLLVTRREGGAGAVSVNFATADGSATAVSDYAGSAGMLNFAAGQLSAAITIPIIKDTRIEGPETFTVTLSNPTGGATLGSPSKATVTILDSEPAGVIQFYRSEYVTTERAAAALITVIRSEGAAGEVSVTYSTEDGTATDGQDYTGVTGTLVFLPGQRTKSFTVRILNDAVPEPAEKLNLILSAPTGGAVLGARAMAVLGIADDDLASKVQFAMPEYRVREDNLAGYAVITVVRRGSLAGTTTVEYTTSDGTATDGQDYTAASGVLEFRPGQAAKAFRVPLLRDDVVEGAESVHLTLQEPTGGILGAPATAVLTIADPEARNGSVQFATPEFKVSEAAGVATITVTRFSTVGGVTVKYAAKAGTATETEDFTPVTGVLEFAAGVAKKTFTVPIVADTLAEEAETILLELSEPTGGALLGSPARAVLRVFDPALTVPGAQ